MCVTLVLRRFGAGETGSGTRNPSLVNVAGGEGLIVAGGTGLFVAGGTGLFVAGG